MLMKNCWEKNFRQQTFWAEKLWGRFSPPENIFGRTNYFRPKKFFERNIFRSNKNLFLMNLFRSNKFSVEQIFGRKTFLPKNLGRKCFRPKKWSAEHFSERNIFQSKHFSIEQIFGSKFRRPYRKKAKAMGVRVVIGSPHPPVFEHLIYRFGGRLPAALGSPGALQDWP